MKEAKEWEQTFMWTLVPLLRFHYCTFEADIKSQTPPPPPCHIMYLAYRKLTSSSRSLKPTMIHFLIKVREETTMEVDGGRVAFPSVHWGIRCGFCMCGVFFIIMFPWKAPVASQNVHKHKYSSWQMHDYSWTHRYSDWHTNSDTPGIA